MRVLKCFALIVVFVFILQTERVFAQALDVPIDQYIHFSSDDPNNAHTNRYKTGLWDGVNHFVALKTSQVDALKNLPPGMQVTFYQLKISDPTAATGNEYLTQAGIWYTCGDITKATYNDVAGCAVFPQTPFAIQKQGTTQKEFDYAPEDALSHWIVLTGQTSGLELDPTKVSWRINYEPAPPTPTPKPQVADANNDLIVNESDYSVWQAHYMQAVTSGSQDGDFNTDGKVDGVDYILWMTRAKI